MDKSRASIRIRDTVASHADVLKGRHAGTRDKPLRTSAWEVTLGTDHLFLVEGLGQFLLSMNFFFQHHYFQEFFSPIKLDKSLQEFFSSFNVILLYQEKNPCEQSGLNHY